MANCIFYHPKRFHLSCENINYISSQMAKRQANPFHSIESIRQEYFLYLKNRPSMDVTMQDTLVTMLSLYLDMKMEIGSFRCNFTEKESLEQEHISKIEKNIDELHDFYKRQLQELANIYISDIEELLSFTGKLINSES